MSMPTSRTPEPVTAITETATADACNMCRYPSKKCWNTRALKRNGEMHNLCDEHRQKANKNQRRLEQKRKTSKNVVATKRKSRAFKSKSACSSSTDLVAKQQPATKRQQQQQAASAAVELVAAAHSLQQHQHQLQHALPVVRLNPAMPAGFFTDLMMSESLFAKPQQLDLGHQRLPTVNDFLEGDLDSLTDCLDYSIPSFANMNSSNMMMMATGCGINAMGNGSSSPIDVCDGLDAVAAVNDFWWHPVLAVDPLLLLDPSALVMSDEIFSFQH